MIKDNYRIQHSHSKTTCFHSELQSIYQPDSSGGCLRDVSDEFAECNPAIGTSSSCEHSICVNTLLGCPYLNLSRQMTGIYVCYQWATSNPSVTRSRTCHQPTCVQNSFHYLRFWRRKNRVVCRTIILQVSLQTIALREDPPAPHALKFLLLMNGLHVSSHDLPCAESPVTDSAFESLSSMQFHVSEQSRVWCQDLVAEMAGVMSRGRLRSCSGWWLWVGHVSGDRSCAERRK